MSWGSLEAFLDMGGYGLFVWGSYGVGVLCVALEMIALRARARRLAAGGR
ncbi:MAG: heme exporter protein CcmD [Burkholderiales bacterium]|nr:heme exporter protein CcmD [Burkholderiales bacterium]